MTFASLIEKMASGQTLDAVEKQELVLQARRLEENSSLLTSLIRPGTKILVVDGLETRDATITDATITDATLINVTAGSGGEVILDEDGIFIMNSTDSWFNFGDADNTRGVINIAVDPNNDFEFVNLADGGSHTFFLGTPSNHDRVMRLDGTPETGYKMVLKDHADGDHHDWRTEGSASGSTFYRMRETSTTPPVGSTDAFHMYMKGDKFIIQFAGAYFYLNLTAVSNQSWIYSATAP